jgi:hypothetical protein
LDRPHSRYNIAYSYYIHHIIRSFASTFC